MLNELKFPTKQSVKYALNPEYEPSIQIDYYLRKKGYKRLDQGHFSTVYIKKNAIVKVSDIQDTGWLKFAALCKKYPNNPYLPKISKVISFQSNGKKLFITFIEKLIPLEDNNDLFLLIAAFFVKLGFKGNTYHNITWEEVVEKYSRNSIEQMFQKFQKEYPGFNEIMNIINKFKKTSNLDLHSDNIMIRGNTPVIIDPYANIEEI